MSAQPPQSVSVGAESGRPAPSRRSRLAMWLLAAVMCAAVAAFIVLQSMPSLVQAGPTWAVGNANQVWLFSHGSVHVLDAGGNRIKSARLDALKLSEHVSDLQPISSDSFLVHDSDKLLRCTMTAKRCERVAQGLDDALRDKAGRKFHFDAASGLLALSDVNHHRLHVFDLKTRPARQIALDSTSFQYPNQPRWIDGALWLADTNHFRLVRMSAPGPEWKIESSLSTASPLLRPGRRFPFAFVRLQGGETWVLVANQKMAEADILVLGADGKPARLIALADDQDPVSLVAVGDRIVVPDVSAFSLTALDRNGNRVGEFGDRAFRDELAAAKDRAEWIRRAPWILGGVLVLCLGAAIAIGVRSGELRPASAASRQRGFVATGGEPGAIADGPPAPQSARLRVAATIGLTALLLVGAFALSFSDLAAISRLSHLTPNMRHLVWVMSLLAIGGVAVAVYVVLAATRWRARPARVRLRGAMVLLVLAALAVLAVSALLRV